MYAIRSYYVDADEKRLFLADLGLDEPGLNRVVRAGYQLLGLCTFFSTQSKESYNFV